MSCHVVGKFQYLLMTAGPQVHRKNQNKKSSSLKIKMINGSNGEDRAFASPSRDCVTGRAKDLYNLVVINGGWM